MFKLLLKLAPALAAGKELSNVAGWKNSQTIVNLLVTILGFVVLVAKMQWPDLAISDEQLLTIATGVATVLAGMNSYLTVATTRKIGIK